jgi:hypothetical protein
MLPLQPKGIAAIAPPRKVSLSSYPNWRDSRCELGGWGPLAPATAKRSRAGDPSRSGCYYFRLPLLLLFAAFAAFFFAECARGSLTVLITTVAPAGVIC